MLIQEYQKKWVTDFESLKRILLQSLQSINISIEHIGSTAVPSLAAKSIIDIDIIYYSEADFENIKSNLEAIGYYHNGDQGILHREVFKRKSSTVKHEVLDLITHHLYVCPEDSLELKRHLLFRNYLRKNKEVRQKYQAIKFQIAKEANQDRKVYAEIKEVKAKDFIQSVLDKAQQELD